MAEADSQPLQETEEKVDELKLKYLEFVQDASGHIAVQLGNIYNYAKDKSGPLKPGVQSVEEKVKIVVSPVFEKFHDVPNDLLKFVDQKVEESVTELDRHVPKSMRRVSAHAISAIHKAPEVARAVVSGVQNPSSVADAAAGLAKKYENVAEGYAVSVWRSLNQIPLFPRVAQVIVPAAAYYSEKYNETVEYTAGRGYKVASFLPLVPTTKIAKVFTSSDHCDAPPVSVH